MGQFGSVKGQAPGNKHREFPAEPLTPEEVGAIIGACSGKAATGVRNRAMLMLLYRSGLRVSEVLAVRGSDVNFAQHSIRLLDTKAGKPQTRGFHPSAEDMLRRWIDKRHERHIKRGPLFCTLDGDPIHAQYVRIMLRRAADKAGIDKRVHPHGLRHTYAVELEQSGLSITKISALLGHSSTAVTDRYLKHLTNAEAIAALAAVELPPLKGIGL